MDETTQFTVRLKDGTEFGPADMATIRQWAGECRIPADAVLVSGPDIPPIPVQHMPDLAPLCVPVVPDRAAADEGGDVMAAMIPYRNPAALVGYYLSIASLFPIIGFLAGPAAVWLGVVGLRKRRREPRIKGAAHAWIAIILGIFGILISMTCMGAIVYGNSGLGF